jgi:hypothetical protein
MFREVAFALSQKHLNQCLTGGLRSKRCGRILSQKVATPGKSQK